MADLVGRMRGGMDGGEARVMRTSPRVISSTNTPPGRSPRPVRSRRLGRRRCRELRDESCLDMRLRRRLGRYADAIRMRLARSVICRSAAACRLIGGQSRHRRIASKWSKVTLSDGLPPQITALRKVYSITSSAIESTAGSNIGSIARQAGQQHSTLQASRKPSSRRR
jgi:hypothetical protein